MPVKYQASEQDAKILDTITTRILQSLSGWYGSAAELVGRTPEIRSYTNSFLLRYEVTMPAGEKAILVKIRRNPKMGTLLQAVSSPDIHANIPDEYETLKLVHERSGDGHQNFTAIRPLAYFEDYYAIVMEEFPARSLRQMLHTQRKNSNQNELIEAARKAGELLCFFHERVYSVVESPYAASQFLEGVKSYAARLEQYTSGRVQSKSIIDAFERKLRAQEIRSIPISAAHQDLTSDNVLYSANEKVCLIDIKTKPAPIYSDLALLLIHPETFRDQIFRGGRYFSPSLLSDYRKAILEGYFSHTPIDTFLVNLFCAFRVLDKWTMHEELFHRYKGFKRIYTRPLSPLVTSYFRALLDRYLQAAT